MIRTIAALALTGTLTLAPSVAGAQPVPAAETDRASDSAPDRHDERRTRFECRAHRSDRGPVIGCRWTPAPTDGRVAGYRLLRAVDRHHRTVVFATRNLREHGHKDLVRPGHTYRYAVQYLAEDGSVLHTSHVERITIPGDRPTDRTR